MKQRFSLLFWVCAFQWYRNAIEAFTFSREVDGSGRYIVIQFDPMK